FRSWRRDALSPVWHGCPLRRVPEYSLRCACMQGRDHQQQRGKSDMQAMPCSTQRGRERPRRGSLMDAADKKYLANSKLLCLRELLEKSKGEAAKHESKANQGR